LKLANFRGSLTDLNLSEEIDNYITDNFIDYKLIDSSDANYFTRLKARRKNYSKFKFVVEEPDNFFVDDLDWKRFFSEPLNLDRRTQNYLTKKI
jgi:hypothetical protein